MSALGILKRSMTSAAPRRPLGHRRCGPPATRDVSGSSRPVTEFCSPASGARHAAGGVEQHLVLTGYVPDEDVAAWFQEAEAAVLPYRRIEQSGVGGPSYAFGVPVLASTAGGLGELYAGSRWTFPPRGLTASPRSRRFSRDATIGARQLTEAGARCAFRRCDDYQPIHPGSEA